MRSTKCALIVPNRPNARASAFVRGHPQIEQAISEQGFRVAPRQLRVRAADVAHGEREHCAVRQSSGRPRSRVVGSGGL
jgi:hypothetical protein